MKFIMLVIKSILIVENMGFDYKLSNLFYKYIVDNL